MISPRMKLCYFIVSLLLCSAQAFAQEVRGIVKDSRTSDPIVAATVEIRKDGVRLWGQQTRLTGEFRITAAQGDSLHVHAVGYTDQWVLIGLDTILTIALQPSTSRAQEITVTATKRATAVQDIPISTSVVRREEIQQRTPDGVDQALRYIPGVSVTEDQVNVRGSSGYAKATGSRVLLLLDGLPFLAADNNDIKFDALPMFDIDRIEVVKGGGSALYGSSALGGVVNVITQQPSKEFHFASDLSGGMYDQPKYEEWRIDQSTRFAKIDLGATGSVGDVGLLGSLTYKRNEGYRIGDDTYRTNGFLKSTIPVGDGRSFTLTELLANENHGGWLYWKSLSQPLVPKDTDAAKNGRIHSFKSNTLVSFSQLLGSESILGIKVNDLFTKFTTDPSVPGGPAGAHSNANAVNGDITFTTPIALQLVSTTGLALTYQDVHSDLFLDHHGTLFGAYEQLEWQLGALTATAGARADVIKYDSTSTESQLSPKLGLNYHLTQDIALRGSLGSGFRAPAIGERFIESVLNGFTVRPNLNLKPERSLSYEVGGSYSTPMLDLDGAVFYSTFADLIEPTFVTEDVAYIQFRNVTRARLYGHEEVIDYYPLSNDLLNLRLGYTYSVAEDLDSKAILKFRPRHLFQARIAYDPKPLSFSTDLRYVSQYETYDTTLVNQVKDGAARTDAYVLDARIGVDLKDLASIPITLSFQVNNLLNYYYVEIVGNMAPLRNYTLKVETRL